MLAVDVAFVAIDSVCFPVANVPDVGDADDDLWSPLPDVEVDCCALL